MNQAAKAQEPSMEEILASIRRIIADDDSKPAPATPMPPPPRPVAAVPPIRAEPAPPPEPELPPVVPVEPEITSVAQPEPEEPEPDVLNLTEAMTVETPPTEGFRTIDGQSDVVFKDPFEESAPVMAAPTEEPIMDMRPLMSSVTSAAVDSAFNSLAHTVLVQNARTLEDLVREMLRPLLKSWLDDNLPGLVERLVRAEIERVSRGRG
jgi:cell pole-organizing protein PopZ